MEQRTHGGVEDTGMSRSRGHTGSSKYKRK